GGGPRRGISVLADGCAGIERITSEQSIYMVGDWIGTQVAHGPDEGKGLSFTPGVAPALPEAFEKIEVVFAMDAGERRGAEVLRLEDLAETGRQDAVAHDLRPGRDLHSRHQPPIRNFVLGIVGEFDRRKKCLHGPAASAQRNRYSVI